MTLIIGCITSKFSIIAGDTQRTVGSHIVGNKPKKESALKVFSPSAKTIYGILGKWTNYYCHDDKTKLNILDYHERMRTSIKGSAHIVDDIYNSLTKYNSIDCTVLAIEKDSKAYRMSELTNKSPLCLKKLKLGDLTLGFNEPFSLKSNTYSQELIELNIRDIVSKYHLGCSLVDALFLVNNVILKIISMGDSVQLRDDKGRNYADSVNNTVGGVVTILLNTFDWNGLTNMSLVYNSDFNTLLDKTTNPFASSLENKIGIRYVDNLAMIYRNASLASNKYIKESLNELLDKQLNFIAEEGIISRFQLNGLIDFINSKFGTNLNLCECDEENLELKLDILLDEDLEDNWFYKRFFR